MPVQKPAPCLRQAGTRLGRGTGLGAGGAKGSVSSNARWAVGCRVTPLVLLPASLTGGVGLSAGWLPPWASRGRAGLNLAPHPRQRMTDSGTRLFDLTLPTREQLGPAILVVDSGIGCPSQVSTR
jgi:hypothetical protein